MTDTAPRSWRSILFKPGRPPLRRRTAILLCLLVFFATLVVDLVLLTNGRVLGRIAAIQIRKHAGDLLSFESLSLNLGGNLRMERVRLNLPDIDPPLFSARRVRLAVGHRDGGIVAESLVLEEPLIRLSDRTVRKLEGDSSAPRRPLSDFFSSRYLPRVSCKGGRVELTHSEILAGDRPQVFEILDLAMIPTTGYRYFVRGSLRNSLVGDWNVQGEIDLDTGDHDVHLSNDRLVLGPPIREALKPALQEAWDKYRPEGPAGADVFLDRGGADGGFRFTLKPRGLSLRYLNFPYPCQDVHGEIDFRADGFTVKHIDARSGPEAKLRFDGSADGYGADAGYHFRLDLDDAAFDDTLKSALGKDAQKVWEEFKPRGQLDARVTMHRERGGPEVKASIPVDLNLRRASILYSGFPFAIERVWGEIRINGEEVYIRRLRGVNGKAEIAIAGRIEAVSTGPVVDLDVRAQSLELNGRLRDALPPEAQKLFDRFSASGEVDVDARVRREAGGEPRVALFARLKDNRVVVRDAPLPVLIQEGTVEYADDRVRFHHLKGVVDPAGEILLSGEIAQGEAGSTTHLEIDGMGITIDERFRDRMPKALGEILRPLRISGISDFKFTLDEKPERDRTSVRVRLQLDLRKGAVASGVPVEDLEGTVVLVGPIRDGKPLLSGRLDVRTARVLKKQIKNFRTNITIQGSVLDFRDIAGDAYGGKLSGWFSLDTVTSDLEGDFALSQLDLREFVNDTAKWTGKTIAGKVDLHIPGLKGKSNDAGTLQSKGGSLIISEGQLVDVPGIVNFLDPFQSAGGRFTAMKAFFEIRNRKFKIHEFAFLGKEGSGSVIGKGDFFFDGHFRLHVRSVTGSLFGLDIFFAKIPGVLFDLFKTPFKKVVEGNLEESNLLDE